MFDKIITWCKQPVVRTACFIGLFVVSGILLVGGITSGEISGVVSALEGIIGLVASLILAIEKLISK